MRDYPKEPEPMYMPQGPGADVVIDEVHADGLVEYVDIENRGQIDQPLTGWALASLHGGEVFRFPAGEIISPGKHLRVLSGEQAPAGSGQNLLWKRESIWSNRSDTALLFDNRGREVSRRTYPRATIREARKPKLKVLVQERDGDHLRDADQVYQPLRGNKGKP